MSNPQGLSLPSLGQQQTSYLMEARNGMLTSVPADKLDEWQKAQNSGQLSPGLSKYKQQIKDRILQDIYGERR